MMATHSGSDLLKDASFLDRTSSSADNNNHNDANNTPMLELHRSNVLRMEVEELYKECRLNDLDSVGWGSFAREYVDYLSRLVERSKAIPVACKNLKETPFCPMADREAKKSSSSPSLPLLGENNKLPRFKFQSVDPPHCIGLTKIAGNANVLPTFQYAIVIPNDFWSGKDYLHYRFVDVSVFCFNSQHLPSVFLWLSMVLNLFVNCDCCTET